MLLRPPSGRKVLWQEMLRHELLEALEQRPVVIVPVGSVEQHGPHCPMDVDISIPYHLAIRAADAIDDFPVIVAPPVSYGFTHYNMGEVGTITIRVELFIELLCDISRSLWANGFRRIILLNGHGGNQAPTWVASVKLAEEDVWALALTYWTMAPDELREWGEEDDQGSIGHGGEWETSLQLYLRGELVDMDRAVRDEWRHEVQPGNAEIRPLPGASPGDGARGDGRSVQGIRGEGRAPVRRAAGAPRRPLPRVPRGRPAPLPRVRLPLPVAACLTHCSLSWGELDSPSSADIEPVDGFAVVWQVFGSLAANQTAAVMFRSILRELQESLEKGAADRIPTGTLTAGPLSYSRIELAMSVRANTTPERWLNPSVLKWAREWRGRTLEEAAARAKKDVRVIEAWEQGEKTPTVRQARDLAAYYGRPFLELLLPEPPELPKPVSLPDYRLHRGVQTPAEDRELQLIQEWAETQRINALDLYSEIGEEPPRFPDRLFATLKDRPATVAVRARKVLGFPIERQVEMTQAEARTLPAILRSRFEEIGVLTLKQTRLAAFGVRGICIAEFPLPIIVFSKESPSAQAFTLVHEFGHVLLKASGVSGEVERRRNATDVERWCNRFTADFLIPPQHIESMLGVSPTRPASSFDDTSLAQLARSLRVSEHAMLIQLVNLNYVSADYYWNVKKPEFDAREREYKGGGVSEYYGSRYRARQGDLYTGLVLEAWATGRITNHNAAEYMGITGQTLRHLAEIRDHFGGA